jgi:hypothetical protein
MADKLETKEPDHVPTSTDSKPEAPTPAPVTAAVVTTIEPATSTEHATTDTATTANLPTTQLAPIEDLEVDVSCDV